MERTTYIESEDRLVVETIYDAEPAIREAEEARQQGGVFVGSKGQQMLKACVIPVEHIQRVKQESGFDLLSPDPDQWRKALLYIQQNHQRFMATDKKVFTGREAQKWV
jgi:uroporphyrinogen-III synthase